MQLSCGDRASANTITTTSGQKAENNSKGAAQKTVALHLPTKEREWPLEYRRVKEDEEMDEERNESKEDGGVKEQA